MLFYSSDFFIVEVWYNFISKASLKSNPINVSMFLNSILYQFCNKFNYNSAYSLMTNVNVRLSYRYRASLFGCCHPIFELLH